MRDFEKLLKLNAEVVKLLGEEREKQIRAIHEYTSTDEQKPMQVLNELLAEIDRLRGENEKLKLDGAHQFQDLRHENVILMKENQRLKAENKEIREILHSLRKLREIAGSIIGKLEEERDALKAENATMRLDLEWPVVKENLRLRERISELKHAILWSGSNDWTPPDSEHWIKIISLVRKDDEAAK